MPFKSEKQRRYLWANEPEIAREWTDRYGARGGGIMRIPFQDAGLASLPYPDYYNLPPFSGVNPNTWTFPTDEEEQITTLSTGEGDIPASYLSNSGVGGGGGGGRLNLTYKEGAAPTIKPLGEYSPEELKGIPISEYEHLKLSDPYELLHPRRRGTLGNRSLAQYEMGQKLPSWLAGIAGIQSPFNPKSRNYNPNFVDQLNYLESSGAPGSYIGIDPQSGLRKYGPDSVLSGQNVWSGWGSNNYATQLAKKRAWFEDRKKANKSFSKKKYQQTKDEITAWENSPKNPKNKNKPIGPPHTILGPDNPLIGKIDHTGGGGHGPITRAPATKGPAGTPYHSTRDDLMAQGGIAGLWRR